MRESLTKQERIRKKSDFKRIFSSSESVGCRGAKMFFKENGLGYCRFGVTLRRHYGNAVERNYARRLVKEIFRTNKEMLSSSYDILLVLYPQSDSLESRKAQYFKLLRRANIAKMD